MIGFGGIRRGFAVLLTIVVVACGSSHVVTSEAAHTPIGVDVQFEPALAHIGHERITVTVIDSNRTAVTGAVVNIAPSYATVPGGHSMRMRDTGRVAKTIHAVEAGHGFYHADVQLTKATHWTFVVEVAAARSQTTISKSLEVL